jgi:glc operon protein GlcG
MIEMTLELAERVAEAARAKAMELGISMTVSVVDESGRLVLCKRGDGTGFFTTDTSRAKAVAAVAFRRTTKELAELQRSSPEFWRALPGLLPGEVLPTTGAVPIIIDGRVVGAVGCGGGTAEEDHECALAGVEGMKEGPRK